MKIIFVSGVLSALNSNMLLQLLYSPQFLYDGILKYNFSKFSFFYHATSEF
jgi:hypothetical protein